uniref:Uncharacterized protein n=1 Tax=Rhipicephalus zambeziensis TaxID=60191 RepID=A0A224YD11_9ACAR
MYICTYASCLVIALWQTLHQHINIKQTMANPFGIQCFALATSEFHKRHLKVNAQQVFKAGVQQPKQNLEQFLEQQNVTFGALKSKFGAGYEGKKHPFFITKDQIWSSIKKVYI